jgi:hypothetical protein
MFGLVADLLSFPVAVFAFRLSFVGIATSNRHAHCATYARCLVKPAGIRRRLPIFVCGIPVCVAVDMRWRCKPTARAETSMPGNSSRNTDNAVRPYCALSH